MLHAPAGRPRHLGWLILAVVALLMPLTAVPASAGTATLSLDRATYTQGQTAPLTATYSTSQVSSTDWVGIYPSDPGKGPGTGNASLAWVYAPNASGSVNLSVSSLPPGSYKAFLLYNDGYTPLAAPVFFTVITATTTTTADSSLCLGQNGYDQGRPVALSYATARAAATNWVGIYPDGQTPGATGAPAALVRVYAPNAAGSLTLAGDALAPGTYAAHFLATDGYTDLAPPARFTVTAPGTSGTNLIVNGDAECGNPSTSGYDGVTLPGWQVSGVPTAVAYGAPGGFPSAATPGPALRGNAFFSGGPVGDSALTQSADVSSAAGQIDGGAVTWNLAGRLGGWSGENSTATLAVTFKDASGTALGTGRIGPVTAADRGSATALLQRTATGTVPAGTRSIAIGLTLTRDPARSGGQYNDAYADGLSLTLSTPLPQPAPPLPPASQVPAFDHVFFVMMENKSYDQVIGSSSAPYLNTLAQQNTTLTQSYGAVHDSDPNYWAVAGGSTFGHTDNPYPTLTGTITSPHLGDLVEGAGKTWRGYIEDMGSPCNLASSGNYDADNLPFAFFRDVTGNPARCQDKLQPITQLWQDLKSPATTPNFVWFEPNSCNTMHNCSVATGDTWMRDNLPNILNSPAWTQQRSLLVITFDEDDHNHGQHIPTIVAASPGLAKPGYQSPAHDTHYSVQRTIEAALGLGSLTQNDQYATPLNDIWN
ncbi:alkaline phosphatase family protein [Kitasatospora aureofaciens]|uniref:alkaline phosphatase family protein n=1 Tax=Kitasatospora aureofaciens TaxID=1894 RepID=UPI003814C0B5